MSAHTPGPWKAATQGAADRQSWFVRTVKDAPYREAIPFVAVMYGTSDAEREANARLIAAAPELLALLIRVEDAFFDARIPAAELDQLRKDLTATIAKAQGRSA